MPHTKNFISTWAETPNKRGEAQLSITTDIVHLYGVISRESSFYFNLRPQNLIKNPIKLSIAGTSCMSFKLLF